MGSAPSDLVVLLYERLLADLEGAALAMRAGDTEGRSMRLQRATDVIFELMSSLDHERGGEVSQRLAALYGYMISRIAEASRRREAGALEEVARHVQSLLAAWRVVASQRLDDVPPGPRP
jgi:flagellar protein FliS